jgi:MFS family permease
MRRADVRTAAACAAGLGLVMTDNTAVAVALPRLAADLGTGIAGQQWVVATMVLATAGSLPASGAIGDRYGARTVFRTGLAVFVAGAATAATGSLVAGLAGLLVGRAVQGVGAALMLPNGAALLSANVEPVHRARVVGLWISISAMGLVVGPLAGGAIVDDAGWRLVFALEAAPAVGGWWLARALHQRPRGTARLDVPGVLVGSVGVAALCSGVVELGREHGEQGLAVAALVVALVAGAVFWPLEHRVMAPAVDVALFRDSRYAALMGACLVYNGVISAEAFLLSLLAQVSPTAGARRAGLVLFAATVLMPVGSQLTGRLAGRLPLRRLMTSAALTIALTLVIAAWLSSGALPLAVPALAMTGMAAGVLFAADTLAVLELVEPERASSGLATLSLVRQCGNVLGVTVLGTVAATSGRLVESTAVGLQLGLAVGGVLALVPAVLVARYLVPNPSADSLTPTV